MPAGRPKKLQGESMSEQELQDAEKRMEGKKSPLRENDFKLPAPSRVYNSVDGRPIKQFGNAASPRVGHQGTLKAFAHIEPNWEEDGWIEMTHEESLKYQDEKVLMGYDADKGLGLIRQTKRGKNEKVPVSSSAAF